MQHAVGIVHGDIEGAERDEGSEVGHFVTAGECVGLLQGQGQCALDEILADLHRVAGQSGIDEAFREERGKVLHACRTFRDAQGAGPDPGHTERSFAPSLGGPAAAILHGDPHAQAHGVGHGFRTELQRHTHRHGNEKHFGGGDADIGGFGGAHGGKV